ncbi:uncharacterized protein ASCRUDRAFT_97173 [Ascoidea rubescens DSM 1968]|uniref:Uncharacterized protein n=1 Tax=Ascoidea rubescens DSM 1968 TaxID=1344418 RepID=A0A1D2VPP0_9ASCO|nr:hypothetical protein ASCRUDRAFT_97173 [Ascoidea rubescens DSM 1968]ODV63580.1 hypothetical protein ASCRUDRAFT_97173 [Ascoidea rubescens DSM 1968]
MALHNYIYSKHQDDVIDKIARPSDYNFNKFRLRKSDPNSELKVKHKHKYKYKDKSKSQKRRQSPNREQNNSSAHASHKRERHGGGRLANESGGKEDKEKKEQNGTDEQSGIEKKSEHRDHTHRLGSDESSTKRADKDGGEQLLAGHDSDKEVTKDDASKLLER